MNQVHEDCIIRLITENNGKFVAGDIIRDKNTDHIQIVYDYLADNLKYDKVLEKWDRVIPYICALDGLKGHEVIHYRTAHKIELFKNRCLVKFDYCRILGLASKASVPLLIKKFIKDGDIISVESHTIFECDNYKNSTTGYWYKIMCPCCEEYV